MNAERQTTMRTIVWLLLAVVCGVALCKPIQDPDLWWHLTVGRWIISHGAVPEIEIWNRFTLGEPWRAYSWLFEVVFCWLDLRFGIYGLLFGKLLVLSLLSTVIFYGLSKLSRNWSFGTLLGIVCTASLYNHASLRPQLLIWLLLALLLLTADRLQREGISSTSLLAVFLTFVLWANLHITTVLGLGAVVGFSLGRNRLGTALAAAAVGFIGTLFTPYLGGEWLTLLEKIHHPISHRAIAEFQSASLLHFGTAFVLLAAGLVASFLIFQPTLLTFGQLITLLLFSGLGLFVVKFQPMSMIVLCSGAAIAWRNATERGLRLGHLQRGMGLASAQLSRVPSPLLGTLVLLYGAVSLSPIWEKPFLETLFPVQAVDFYLQEELPKPLANSFNEGGYLMYRLSDAHGRLQHPVSIDGRTNATPPDIFESFKRTYLAAPDWKQYLEKTKANTVLWPRESPLTRLLKQDREWCLVFRSGSPTRGFALYSKREALTSNSNTHLCIPEDGADSSPRRRTVEIAAETSFLSHFLGPQSQSG